MEDIKKYRQAIKENSDKIIKKDKKWKKILEKIDEDMKKQIKIYIEVEELKQFQNIKKIDYINYLELDIEINNLKNEIEDNKNRKNTFSKFLNSESKKKNKLKEKNDNKETIIKINSIIDELNKKLEKRIDEIYEKNKNKLVCIENFLFRKLFVEYSEILLNELRLNDEEIVKAFIYNIEKRIEKIKSDEDNWMLGKNIVKDLRKIILNRNSLEISSKKIINSISQTINDRTIKKIIINMYNNDSLKNNIEFNNEIKKITEKIDLLILDFLDIVNESNSVRINKSLEPSKVYEELIFKLGYHEINLKKLDKLDTEFCTTLESEDTIEIEKDFLISKIHKKGYKTDKKVLRRTIVNVYRYSFNE